ncbi:MAG: GFA family protein [Pseudomonadota bacterium]
MHRASCLCGAVRIAVTEDLPAPTACHCTICRKHTGHFEVSTDVPKDRVTLEGEDKITWYASSDKVRRGFCSICGSTLLFDPPHRDWIAISMGAFDTPTGVRLAGHIFVADKGDYYDITDGLPQNAQ